MRNSRIVCICALLGLLIGIGVSWFVSVQSGITFETWMTDLFISPTWQGWVVCAATLLLPILIGLRTGLVRNDISGILLTPVYAVLAAAVALIIAAVALMVMENLQVVSFIGFVAIVGILMPATYSVVVILIG